MIICFIHVADKNITVVPSWSNTSLSHFKLTLQKFLKLCVKIQSIYCFISMFIIIYISMCNGFRSCYCTEIILYCKSCYCYCRLFAHRVKKRHEQKVY